MAKIDWPGIGEKIGEGMKETFNVGDIIVMAGIVDERDIQRYLVLSSDQEIDAEGNQYNQYQVLVRNDDDTDYFTDQIDDINVEYRRTGHIDIFEFID